MYPFYAQIVTVSKTLSFFVGLSLNIKQYSNMI